MNQFLLVGISFLVVVLVHPPVGAGEIIVSAAASLTDALTEIGKTYEVKSRNRVSFNFGASSNLARQIEEGAPADLFFSADLEKMENLKKQRRIEDSSWRNLLSNRLVIVVSKNSTLTIKSPRDLLRGEVKRIALGEPSSVPVGIYTRKYLEEEGVWERIKSKLIPVMNVRATLAAVESGNVDVGFIYKTDAVISHRVTIVYEVPREKGPKIIYPVGLVRESKKKEGANDFLKFLLSETGKGIFRKYGFIILE